MRNNWIPRKSPSQCPAYRRRKSRRGFRESEIKELAEIARATGVAVTLERDGTKVTVGGDKAGNGAATNRDDLDHELADFVARHPWSSET